MHTTIHTLEVLKLTLDISFILAVCKFCWQNSLEPIRLVKKLKNYKSCPLSHYPISADALSLKL